jgi:hypothetical protein
MPMPMNTPSDFWKRVDKSGDCWLWQGWMNPDGYGEFRMNYHTHLAHRLSYEWANGEIPDGMCVCHSCDVPACVNPDHLFLGTQADNVRDRHEKGHTAHGEGAAASKLTVSEVRTIRELFDSGRSKRSLAVQFGVSRKNIRCIVNRDTWAWLS